MDPPSKESVFDLFYGKQLVTRAGGGTSKSRMTRKSPSMEAMEAMRSSIGTNTELMTYFKKLRDRDPNLAPPPKPSV